MNGRINSIGSWFEKNLSGFTFGIQNEKIIVKGTIEMEASLNTGYTQTFQDKSGIVAHIGDLNHLTGATFSTSTGILALSGLTGGTINVDLDGRYVESSGFDGNYLPLSGGTMTNTNLVTNLNTDLLDGLHVEAFSLSGHTHPQYLTTYNNDYVSSAGFNDTSGLLTLTRQSGATVTVNLDGRYAISSGLTTVNDGQLTMNVAGVGLTSTGATFTANQSGSTSFTVTSNATPSNTTNTIVSRDSSGNFSANTITDIGGDSTEWNTAYDNTITGVTFTSGSGLLSLEQQDGGTVTENLDGRYELIGGVVDTNDYVNSMTWNSANGDLTLNMFSGGTVVENLDNRYQLTGTTVTSVTVNSGAGITVNETGTALAPIFEILVDYLGTNNIIDSATNLEGTAIASGDTIMYHDATDNNIKKGFVSDLPFDLAGTDNSTDVTLAGTPDYITISGQIITRNKIDLTSSADVQGNLEVARLASGTGASSATYWRGDGTWDTPDDTQLSNLQVISSTLDGFTSFGSVSTVVAADSIFTAFRKLEYRVDINDAKVTNSNYYLTGVSGSGNGTVTFSVSGTTNPTWDASHTHSLTAITEFDITSAVKGDILAYNGSNWVDLTVGSNGTILTANSGEATGLEWGSAPASALSGLTDVTFTSVNKGDIVIWDGGTWVDFTVGANNTILKADSTQPTGVKWESGSVGTGTTIVHTQTSSATTWSFQHNLGTLFPVFNVWTEDNKWIEPLGMEAIDADNAEITFSIARKGYVCAVVGGVSSTLDTLSALTDTNVAGVGDGEVLTWNSGTAKWISSAVVAGNDYVNSGSFNTSSGVVTLTRISGGTVDYGLDGKYLDLSGGTLTGNITAPAFVTSGGLSSQLVKGDGSLQSDTFYSLTGHTHSQYALESALVSHSGNTSNPHNTTLTGLTDTELSATSHGYVITYNSGTTQWEATSASTGTGSATIIDDDAPTLVVGGTWYQPTTGKLHVGVDDSWVEVIKDGMDATANSNSGTTVIDLTQIGGYYYDMASANSATTYTTTGTVLGAFACVLINAATEPTVTGGTKIAGSTFETSTDMHMWVQYFGVTVQYYFTTL